MSSCGIVSACALGTEIESFFVDGDISLDDFTGDAGDVDEGTTTADQKPKTKDRSKWYWRRLSDKSDSLLYFPHSLAYLRNSGDMDGAAELIRRHFHKKALVHITGTSSMVLSVSMYISLLSILDVLYCDALSCVRSTAAADGQILSKVYFSYTDVAAMYRYREFIVKDSLLRNAFTGERRDVLRRRLKLPARSSEVQAKLTQLIESDQSLLLHGKVKITITFDQHKLKITRLDYACRILSVFHNGEKYRLREKKKKHQDLLAEGY